MAEYKVVDAIKYDYEQITEDYVWTYGVMEKAGVVRLTNELYEQKILNMKKGDTPWWVVIVAPGVESGYWHSSYVMKTLYFLKRDYPDKVNCAYINTHDEGLRELFENDGLP